MIFWKKIHEDILLYQKFYPISYLTDDHGPMNTDTIIENNVKWIWGRKIRSLDDERDQDHSKITWDIHWYKKRNGET